VLLKARGNWKTGRGLTGTPVSDIDSQGFKLGDQFVPARTVVWAAGCVYRWRAPWTCHWTALTRAGSRT
jgi:hypothetical protein